MSPLKELRHSLAVKVAVLIVGILIAGFGTLLLLSVQRDSQIQIAKHMEGARLLATSMMTIIENGMLEGRPDIIRRLVREMKSELKEVRLYRVIPPGVYEKVVRAE